MVGLAVVREHSRVAGPGALVAVEEVEVVPWTVFDERWLRFPFALRPGEEQVPHLQDGLPIGRWVVVLFGRDEKRSEDAGVQDDGQSGGYPGACIHCCRGRTLARLPSADLERQAAGKLLSELCSLGKLELVGASQARDELGERGFAHPRDIKMARRPFEKRHDPAAHHDGCRRRPKQLGRNAKVDHRRFAHEKRLPGTDMGDQQDIGIPADRDLGDVPDPHHRGANVIVMVTETDVPVGLTKLEGVWT